MENKKDIGKVFREKLDGFDPSPDAKIWGAIQADLQQKKKRRFVFPFWFKTAGFGIILAGLIFLLVNRNTDSNGHLPQHSAVSGRTTPEIDATGSGNATQSKTNSIGNPGEKTSDPKDGITTKADNGIANSQHQSAMALKGKGGKAALAKKRPNASYQKKSIKRKPGSGVAELQKTPGENATAPTSDAMRTIENANPNLTDQTVANTHSADKQETAIAANEQQKDSLKTPKKESGKDSTATRKREWQKLSVFVYGSPTYGGYFSKDSPLDKRLDKNDRHFKTTISYGAYAVYQATEKWGLRFGISFMNLESVTRDAAVDTYNYANISYAENSNATIHAQSNAETMDLTQQISYTEIPLELKYAIRDRKLGVNLYGGLSYLFLNKNEISAKTANGMRFDLGKTTNLSSNAFTVNIGIGIDYKFSKSIRANLEPVFKYHLMDYKENAAKPYSISVLTGLQFSFQ